MGDGDISIWYDRSLDHSRLCDLVSFVDIQDIHIQVHDIVHEGHWDFSLSATILDYHLKSIICAIQVSLYVINVISRHISLSSGCPCCGSELEDSVHCLHDCFWSARCLEFFGFHTKEKFWSLATMSGFMSLVSGNSLVVLKS